MAVETAAPSASGAPQLSFPRDIFAALSPAPFLLAHLDAAATTTTTTKQKGAASATRPNGRTPTECRAPTVNTGSLTHCNGSAVVRLGDTAVVCGVRAEILKADDVPNPPRYDDGDNNAQDDDEAEESWDDRDELERLGLLVPNVELATGATPALMPGQPPSAQAQALTSRLLGAVHATRIVRAKDLRITYVPPRTAEEEEEEEGGERRKEVKAYWTLYVDVLFISLDGNAWDAAWAAVAAALRDTVLPRAWWDADMATVLCSDRAEEARTLRLRGRPVALTCVVFEPGKGRGVGAPKVLGVGGEGGKAAEDQERAWVLADPDAFEEANCKETVGVLVDVEDGQCVLHGIEKSGGGVVDRDVLRGAVTLAEERWKVWGKALSEAGSKG